MEHTYYENLGTVSLVNSAVTVGGDVTLQRQHHTFYITGNADVASGAVTIETAPSESETGTWAVAVTAVTVVASTVVIARVEGAFGALRARVSTAIADSGAGAETATVVYCAN